MDAYRELSPRSMILAQMKQCSYRLCQVKDARYIHAMDALDLAISLLEEASEGDSRNANFHILQEFDREKDSLV